MMIAAAGHRRPSTTLTTRSVHETVKQQTRLSENPEFKGGGEEENFVGNAV